MDKVGLTKTSLQIEVSLMTGQVYKATLDRLLCGQGLFWLACEGIYRLGYVLLKNRYACVSRQGGVAISCCSLQVSLMIVEGEKRVGKVER